MNSISALISKLVADTSSVGAGVADDITKISATSADDIMKVSATSADDIATSAKLVRVDFHQGTVDALGKVAPVATDDIAASGESMADAGLKSSRELPVIWKIFTNSVLSKTVMIPLAILMSSTVPYIIPYILIIAGIYLSYEGVEKILDYFDNETEDKPKKKISEKERIWNASKIDAILSIEIVVLSLASIGEMHWKDKLIMLSIVCYTITIIIYAAVAFLVRIDDIGAAIYHKTKFKKAGRSIIAASPKIMAIVGFLGTIAMFLVGGGILVHNVEWLHHTHEHIILAVSPDFKTFVSTLFEVVVATIIGSVGVFVHSLVDTD